MAPAANAAVTATQVTTAADIGIGQDVNVTVDWTRTSAGGDTIIVSQKSIFHNPDYIITDRLILMQYTGLKDKHGTEIYEGDIVRGRNDMFDFGEDVLFEIGWLPEEKGYGMHWNPDEVEVVGNLFGSPDLMEGGK